MAYLNESGLQRLLIDLRNKLVPQTRTVNNQPLSSNVTITAQSLGALTSVPTATITQTGTVREASVNITLDLALWQGTGPFTYNYTWPGVTASDVVSIGLNPSITPGSAVAQLEEWGKVASKFAIRSYTDTVTITAYGDKPILALPVTLQVVN